MSAVETPFEPAGTTWVVTLYDDPLTGVRDPRRWCFRSDGTFSAGSEQNGRYAPIADSDNAYLCEILAVVEPPGTDLPREGRVVDSFIAYFISPDLFVAVKHGVLYRFGNRFHESDIDVMIVIDAESFANGDGNDVLMFADSSHALGGNGTSQLRLRAHPRDVLRIATVSMSNQFEYVALVYDVEHIGGDTAVDAAGLRSRTITQLAVVELPSRASHEPPQVEFREENFYVCEVDIREPGAETFDLKFVVYGPPRGGERPMLGHFATRCSVTIDQPARA